MLRHPSTKSGSFTQSTSRLPLPAFNKSEEEAQHLTCALVRRTVKLLESVVPPHLLLLGITFSWALTDPERKPKIVMNCRNFMFSTDEWNATTSDYKWMTLLV
mmetsp:Transcript_17540/g.33263  ORF Transcript_17540/g.33263 Transcript_17540/m.33263 type:complete len:103 (-) Transcript_17540:136-444(-)